VDAVIPMSRSLGGGGADTGVVSATHPGSPRKRGAAPVSRNARLAGIDAAEDARHVAGRAAPLPTGTDAECFRGVVDNAASAQLGAAGTPQHVADRPLDARFQGVWWRVVSRHRAEGVQDRRWNPTSGLEALVDADLDTLATALYVKTDPLKAARQWAPTHPPVGIAR